LIVIKETIKDLFEEETNTILAVHKERLKRGIRFTGFFLSDFDKINKKCPILTKLS
jgi:hypothetical protein